ncbi:MAG: hypothetical protein NTU51_00660 [Bacteroidetes bacterium]|nr:hypothetical protein [Bacteroidota bacterium]
MKKNKLTVYLSILISLILLGTYASAQETVSKPVNTVNFPDLLGKWKTHRISANNIFQPLPPKPAVQDTAKKQAAPQQKMDKTQMVELKKTAVAMRNSVMEFLPDKSAVKTTADKSEKYSWKTKKKDLLTIKNLTTKEKTKMQIFKLNSDTLQVVQILKSGNLYVFYLREK